MDSDDWFDIILIALMPDTFKGIMAWLVIFLILFGIYYALK